jgi:ribosomal subunit interface protein
MQVAVTGKQIDVGDAFGSHVETRLSETVENYFDQPVDAAVVFSREGKSSALRTDISVHVGRNIQMHGRGQAGDAYASFEIAAERIAKQPRCYKRRLRDYHRKEAAEETAMFAQRYILVAEYSEDDEQIADADNPVVIAETTMTIDAPTVSETVMRMDLVDTTALIFTNRAHGELNVVYRRADGNIGWIDPQGNTQGGNIG